ncbi:MAG TPA: SRPBCC family protein [Arenimonas sp.]|uniref:SRPBCC family protein n=1 Tax=Arenimonas sp. TaxID=1872635 RepID=UPI002B90F558|nr:SRPBCC family protein [Arenimonas sp.]HMB56514.1 SRPBCC family protein [Arenimonas sp.]
MKIQLQAQREIAAPAMAAYLLCIDAKRFPSLFHGCGPISAIREVTLDAPLAIGSTRRIHNADGSVLSERITALDPPSRHAYVLSGFTAPFSWLVKLGEADWRIANTETGAGITWNYTFTLSSPLAWPVCLPLLKIFMQGAMRRCLDAMANTLEGKN